MAKVVSALTNTKIDKAKAKDKEYSLSDGGGLALRIRPNGSKSWLFNYTRPITKKRNNLGLGGYPALSLANARQKAIEFRKLLVQNIDPQIYIRQLENQKTQELNNTLLSITNLWFKDKQKTVSSNYSDDIYRSFELHIFPTLGKTPISEITSKKVIECLKPIELKGSLETVKRLCQRLNEVMDYALTREYIIGNPLTTIYRPVNFKPPTKQHQPALKPEELSELMLALAQASIKKKTRCLIEWQLHTMTRPKEASGTEWSEIDFDKNLWIIPAKRMKMNKEHIIPLTKQALTLLEIMRPISGQSNYVFNGDRNYHTSTNSQTANMAIKRMGFSDRLVSHGLRSIASTTLNELYPEKRTVIDACLSHHSANGNEVEKAYNRATYLEQRKELMQIWSDIIIKASQGSLSLSDNTNSSLINDYRILNFK